METINYFILGAAVIVLSIGLWLHFWSVSTRGLAHFHATTVVAWLLIALFPVLILFSFFPNSEIHGTIFGVSAGGAAALFLVIWHYGPKRSAEGRMSDNLNQTIMELENENFELKEQLRDKTTTAAKPLRHAVYAYCIEGAPKKSLAIITGDLVDVKECDCWVNSENNYMQMSRVFEKSISAVIRYYGARRDSAGNIEEDIIADELNAALKGAKVVLPASVYLTSGGQLKASHGVKIIAHVASVTGQVGVGWIPIDNIHRCVTSVLNAVNGTDVQSVLFPLMGTGQAAGKRKINEIAQAQIEMAVDFLSTHPQGNINSVCFLAWSESAYGICKSAIASLSNVDAVV